MTWITLEDIGDGFSGTEWQDSIFMLIHSHALPSDRSIGPEFI